MGEEQGRGTYLLYRYLGMAMASLPEPVVAPLAGVVGDLLARRDSFPRRMARRHLETVLGSRSSGVPVDPELLDRLVRRSFRAYARYWMEGARLPRTPPAEVDQRMMIESGREHLDAGMAAGRGVVMALPHVGSWEWGGAWLALEGMPMTAVVERVEPEKLFEWFVEERRAMGLSIVPLDGEASGTVLRILRDGGLVGLLCDRDLTGNGVQVDFFGEPTTFPGGPALLAMRAGAMLIAGAVYSGPGRQHRAALSAPLDLSRTGSMRQDVARVTQDLAREFETFIRRFPEQWHLFQPNWPSDLEAGPAS